MADTHECGGTFVEETRTNETGETVTVMACNQCREVQSGAGEQKSSASSSKPRRMPSTDLR